VAAAAAAAAALTPSTSTLAPVLEAGKRREKDREIKATKTQKHHWEHRFGEKHKLDFVGCLMICREKQERNSLGPGH